MPSEIVSTLLEILHDAILYQLKEQGCEVEFQPFLRFWLAVVAVAHLIRCVSTLLKILVFMEIPKWIKIRELTVSTLLEIQLEYGYPQRGPEHRAVSTLLEIQLHCFFSGGRDSALACYMFQPFLRFNLQGHPVLKLLLFKSFNPS